MAESQRRRSGTYSVKKVHGSWFLENSNTLQTKRLPFLSNKDKVTLKENYIFADDNVYEIKESESGVTCIEKVEDLIYSTPQQGLSPSTWPRRSGIAKRDVFSLHTLNDTYRKSEASTDSRIENDRGPVNCYMEEVNGVFRSIRDVKTSSCEYDNAGADTPKSVGIGGAQLQMNSREEHLIKQPKDPVTRQVMMGDTKLSKLCDLKGKMELRVNESGVSFHDTKSKLAAYTFSNRWIRNFGFNATTTDDMFYIEVGRKCPKGEGNILFTTDGKAKLHQSIRHLWNNQS